MVSKDVLLCIFFSQQIIKSSTGLNAEVNVVPTGKLCDLNACYPNPCSNKGRCGLSVNSAGGYQCVCPDTYTGRNCSEDVDECVTNSKSQTYSLHYIL